MAAPFDKAKRQSLNDWGTYTPTGLYAHGCEYNPLVGPATYMKHSNIFEKVTKQKKNLDLNQLFLSPRQRDFHLRQIRKENTPSDTRPSSNFANTLNPCKGYNTMYLEQKRKLSARPKRFIWRKSIEKQELREKELNEGQGLRSAASSYSLSTFVSSNTESGDLNEIEDVFRVTEERQSKPVNFQLQDERIYSPIRRQVNVKDNFEEKSVTSLQRTTSEILSQQETRTETDQDWLSNASNEHEGIRNAVQEAYDFVHKLEKLLVSETLEGDLEQVVKRTNSTISMDPDLQQRLKELEEIITPLEARKNLF